MRIILIICLAAFLWACTDSVPQAEVIVLTAIEDVQLVDPGTVVGKPIQVIGYLPAGTALPVSECRERKSDIDVIVITDGKPAVAWKGKYKLIRRFPDPGKDSKSPVTKSCSVFLIGAQSF
jgi:hypothetical protein